ncbi:MAG: histone deacetylase family protein [Acidimicrobiia bacterium]
MWESMGVEVVYLSHDVFYQHFAGDRHVERSERLRAVADGMHRSGLAIKPVVPLPADRAALTLVHDPPYVDALEEFCLRGGGSIDSDTHAVVATWEASLRAAGSGLTAIPVLDPGGIALAAVRPPGHHATSNRAMGFCFLNNVAVAAAHLRRQGSRVAIIDWDVHHGNGTQEMFLDAAEVLYVSIHQAPFYPLTGQIEDIEKGQGTTVNLPIPHLTGGDLYRRAFEELVSPIVTQFQPDWLLISAGYDAHQNDPLGGLRLQASDYGYMAQRLREILPVAPAIVFLEGGYDLEALASGVDATLRGLADLSDFSGAGDFADELDNRSPQLAYQALEVAKQHAARFWSL